MLYIYCLALENNKFYIGKTENPNVRLDNHIEGKGSKWTKLYKPVELLELINNCDNYDEDKYVRIYMDKHGIENVRGGSFCTIKLSQDTIKELEKMSRGTNDKCFKCGGDGHFAKKCKNKSLSKIVVNKVKTFLLPEDKKVKKYKKLKLKVECFRCGRQGHYATKCKNKTTVNGINL
jgi:hypothetical protein